MKTKIFLLPYRFKVIGLVTILLTILFYFVSKLSEGSLIKLKLFCYNGWADINSGFGIHTVDMDTSIQIIGVVLSLLFIALSKERIEDECMSAIRAKAFNITLLFSSALIVISTILIFGIEYLNVLIANLFSFPLIYIIVQRVLVYRFYRQNSYEE